MFGFVLLMLALTGVCSSDSLSLIKKVVNSLLEVDWGSRSSGKPIRAFKVSGYRAETIERLGEHPLSHVMEASRESNRSGVEKRSIEDQPIYIYIWVSRPWDEMMKICLWLLIGGCSEYEEGEDHVSQTLVPGNAEVVRYESSSTFEVWQFHFLETPEEGHMLDFRSYHSAVFTVSTNHVIHSFCRVILLALSCHYWLGCRVILLSLVCCVAVSAHDPTGSVVSLCCFGREGLATSIRNGAGPRQSWIVEWGSGEIML